MCISSGEGGCKGGLDSVHAAIGGDGSALRHHRALLLRQPVCYSALIWFVLLVTSDSALSHRVSRRRRPRKSGLENVTVTANARTRMNFAVLNLFAAARFSRSVGDLEAKHQGQEFGPFFEDILADATACLFLCVASLESYANELFIDRAAIFNGVPTGMLDQLWKDTERKPVICKFEIILRLLGAPPLVSRNQPYLDTNLLISLRNALMHFKPEWEDEKVAHAKLSNRLKQRVSLSPFLPPSETAFPKGWACHACTTWAVKTCISFAAEFSRNAQIDCKYAKPAYQSKLQV